MLIAGASLSKRMLSFSSVDGDRGHSRPLMISFRPIASSFRTRMRHHMRNLDQHQNVTNPGSPDAKE